MAFNATGIAQGAIQAGQAAGAFDPQGSVAMTTSIRRNALRNGDNLRRRNAILSKLMGLDPNQARVAQIGADTAASSDTANALNDARYNDLASNRDYSRSLLGGRLGQEDQLAQIKYQHDLNKPTLGGQLGSLAGMAAGAYFGGPSGAQLGGKLGGRLGGGGRGRLPNLSYLKGAAGI